jgi:YD repeat-containing protein
MSVRTHDEDGKVIQIDTGGDFYGYEYDDASRITSVTNASDSNLSWTYEYDGLDRLTSAAGLPRSHGYTYDANGNRQSDVGIVDGTAHSLTLTTSGVSNRLASISGTRANTYSYDPSGNITGKTNADRPVAIGSTMSTTYVYNALSQRVSKTSGSASTYFFYDEAGHLIGEYGPGGLLIQETVWMGDIPVATLRPRVGGGIDIYYVHTDQLNTPRKASRPSDNALVWRWDPSPFGDTLPNENPQAIGTFIYNLRFPGAVLRFRKRPELQLRSRLRPLQWPVSGVRSNRAARWN